MRTIAALVLAAGLAAPAAGLELVDKLEACAALVPDDKRLQCYDRIALQEDRRPWLKAQFGSIAGGFEEGVRLIDAGDMADGLRRVSDALAMTEHAASWSGPVMSTSGRVRHKIGEMMQGAAEDLGAVIDCANAWDIRCVRDLSAGLGAQFRALEGLVQADIDGSN